MLFKKCTKCHKRKTLDDFYKDKNNKTGYRNSCKKCDKEKHKEWLENNKNYMNEYHKNYRLENKEKIKQDRLKLKKEKPWYDSYFRAKQRCNNYNCKDYPWYGGKGILFLLTQKEYNILWLRDKAYDMQNPSIDRIDSNGHYTFENCRFIEQSLNSSKDKRKPIVQYDLEGNFIREWESITNAAKETNQSHSNIADCCKGKTKTAKGSVWKFKEIK